MWVSLKSRAKVELENKFGTLWCSDICKARKPESHTSRQACGVRRDPHPVLLSSFPQWQCWANGCKALTTQTLVRRKKRTQARTFPEYKRSHIGSCSFEIHLVSHCLLCGLRLILKKKRKRTMLHGHLLLQVSASLDLWGWALCTDKNIYNNSGSFYLMTTYCVSCDL